jgi:HSP20 family protein
MLAYVIEMAAPGLKTSDFKVSINRKILTISCLHKEGECEKKVYRQQEFNFRCFKKEIVMPENVNSCLVSTGYCWWNFICNPAKK